MPAEQPQDLHTEFANALNAGDLDAIAALYEDNATLIANGAVVQGIAEIRQALAGYLSLKPQIDLWTVSVLQGASDLALLEGKWSLHGTADDGSPVEMHGTTREVVRRNANGTWLFVLDDPGTGK